MRAGMRRSFRIGLALAGALALHALLFVALPRAAEPKASKRASPPPLSVTLVTPPSRPMPPPSAALPVSPPHVAPGRVIADHKGGGRPEGPRLPAVISDHTGQEAVSAGPVPWSREWTEAEGVAGGLTTELKDPLASAPPPPEAPPADEKTVVRERVQGWANDVAAKSRAEVPDAYWRGVRQALETGFSPTRDMITGGPLEQWQAAARRYARGENPFGGERGDEPHNELRGLDSTSLSGVPSGGLDVMAIVQLVQGGAHRLIATVKITQKPDGAVKAVELTASSGSRAYDKLAVAQARSLDKRQLGPPKQGVITLWAFLTDFNPQPHTRVLLEAIY